MATVTLHDMNTNVIPVMELGSYGGHLQSVLDDVFVWDCVNVDALDPDEEEYSTIMELIDEKYDGRDAFWAQALEEVPAYIQQAFDEYDIPATILTDTCRWHHPQYYNFSNDQLVFNMTIDTDWVADVYANLVHDDNFVAFLSKKYSSRDGFISFIPNSTAEFDQLLDPNNADYWKVVSAIITYQVEIDPQVAESVTNDFVEYMWETSDYETFSSLGIY